MVQNLQSRPGCCCTCNWESFANGINSKLGKWILCKTIDDGSCRKIVAHLAYCMFCLVCLPSRTSQNDYLLTPKNHVRGLKPTMNGGHVLGPKPAGFIMQERCLPVRFWTGSFVFLTRYAGSLSGTCNGRLDHLGTSECKCVSNIRHLKPSDRPCCMDADGLGMCQSYGRNSSQPHQAMAVRGTSS